MPNILITGATGNVGIEVIKALQKLLLPLNIIAGLRNIHEDSGKMQNYNIACVNFDVTNPSTFTLAFKDIDVLFLLRPPQISGVKKYFVPLIKSANEAGIKHIVFLSVQGVKRSNIIPHNKIERLIVESKIAYTFLQPAYFMQNFTTTLHDELVYKKRIYLPAGNAKFTLIDVRDIGKVAAEILTNTAIHINKSYELTSQKKVSFHEMTVKLSNGLGFKINYESPNLLNFYLAKRKEKTPSMLILVLIMLHYLPRFQKEPTTTNCVEEITGNKPISFESFINDYKKILTQ